MRAAYEVVYGTPYTGQICEYSEPALGFAKSPMKGNPRWHRMLFLCKVDGQDSFLLFNGTSLILTRSVHRVRTCSNQLDFTHGSLQRVQFVPMAILSWFWWKSGAYKAQSDSKSRGLRTTSWNHRAQQTCG